MLGESGVGKTCIFNRYMTDIYEVVQVTNGANFASKIEEVQIEGMQDRVKVKLQIWDTAGSEKYRALTPIYYKNAEIICLVYDSTSHDSFDNLEYWLNEVLTNCTGMPIVCIIAAKIDNDSAIEVPEKVAQAFTQKIPNAEWYQTSSRNGTGIKHLFDSIAYRLVIRDLQQSSNSVNLRQRK